MEGGEEGERGPFCSRTRCNFVPLVSSGKVRINWAMDLASSLLETLAIERQNTEPSLWSYVKPCSMKLNGANQNEVS